jgi:ion channel-forming bestrophin family protein
VAFPNNEIAIMADQDKAAPTVGISSASTSYFSSASMANSRNAPDHVDHIEELFHGPRDINRHSKWPYFLRLHGSVLPRMIVPLSFVGAWATWIVLVDKMVTPLGVK